LGPRVGRRQTRLVGSCQTQTSTTYLDHLVGSPYSRTTLALREVNRGRELSGSIVIVAAL
jgi:hypothetical protein